MKRFTETSKWDDKWYRSLSPEAKLLRDFIVDKCDQVGIWEPDLEAASFSIGRTVSQKHLDEIADRLQLLPSGKYLVRRFIHFQYGELSERCPPHKTVLRLIAQNGLVQQGLDYVHANGKPLETQPIQPPGPIERARRFVKPTLQEVVDHGKLIDLSESECRKFHNYYESKGWLVGKSPMKSWPHAMNNWKSNATHQSTGEKRVDRSIGTANEGTAHLYEGLGRVVKT